MSIDWSVAPEGFDYYLIGRSLAAPGKAYMKIDSVQRYVSASGSFVAFEDAGEFEIHRRPAWTGEGLPPVGTVCAVQDPNEPSAWYVCRIIAHDSEIAVFKSESEYPWMYGGQCSGCFRPIRTPEQIAQDDRDKAISQMEFDTDCLDRGAFTRLYDAGWRKEVKS